MGKSEPSQKRQTSRPAFTPEARENQLIALAVDRAEKQLRDGTASSQVITHYLKLGASKEKDRLEIELTWRKRTPDTNQINRIIFMGFLAPLVPQVKTALP